MRSDCDVNVLVLYIHHPQDTFRYGGFKSDVRHRNDETAADREEVLRPIR